MLFHYGHMIRICKKLLRQTTSVTTNNLQTILWQKLADTNSSGSARCVCAAQMTFLIHRAHNKGFLTIPRG